MVKGFCMKCRTQVEISDGKEVTMKNRRKATRGKCAKCGTSVFRIM